jgi:hypothetical protein
MSQDRVESPDNKALLAFAESIFKVALPVSGPPSVPPDRLDALRAGFNAATASKSYLEEAEKFGIDASALDGVEVKRIIEKMKRTPPGVIQRYKDILTSAK